MKKIIQSLLLISSAFGSLAYAYESMTIVINNNTDYKLMSQSALKPGQALEYINPHSSKSIVIASSRSDTKYIKEYGILSSEPEKGGYDYCYVAVDVKDQQLMTYDIYKKMPNMLHKFTCKAEGNVINVNAVIFVTSPPDEMKS